LYECKSGNGNGSIRTVAAGQMKLYLFKTIPL
jgi:hypothetical protein